MCSDCYCLQPKEGASPLDTVHAASSGFLHNCTRVPHTRQSPGKHNKSDTTVCGFPLLYWVFVPLLKHPSSDYVEHVRQVSPKAGVTVLWVTPRVSLKEARALFPSSLGPWEALNVQWVCSVAASRSAL